MKKIIEQEQLELFTSRLPHRPYCSDDKTARMIRGRATALRFPYIQANPPSLKFWLPFDLDKPGGMVAWEDADLPPPAVGVGNPTNGHAHLLWGLDAPVCTSEAARAAPLRYLHAIEGAMLARLMPYGADAGFAGLMVKNPAHQQWRAHWGPPKLYELGELADWLDLDKFKPKRALLKDIEGYGVGRNVSIFNALGPEGKWAYSAVRRYRRGPFEEWHNAVFMQACELNAGFRAPLPFSEVKAIAKSVAKWVWKQDKAHAAEFSRTQARRGAIGGEASGRARAAANEDKRASARLMAAQGYSSRAIAEALEVNQSTVVRWLGDA